MYCSCPIARRRATIETRSRFPSTLRASSRPTRGKKQKERPTLDPNLRLLEEHLNDLSLELELEKPVLEREAALEESTKQKEVVEESTEGEEKREELAELEEVLEESTESSVEPAGESQEEESDERLPSRAPSERPFTIQTFKSKAPSSFYGTASFDEVGLSPDLQQALKSINITRPSHIQVLQNDTYTYDHT